MEYISLPQGNACKGKCVPAGQNLFLNQIDIGASPVNSDDFIAHSCPLMAAPSYYNNKLSDNRHFYSLGKLILGRSSLDKGNNMYGKIIDLSVPLMSGIASDPESFLPEIEYVDNKHGALQLAESFPGLDPGAATPGGLGGGVRPHEHPRGDAYGRPVSLPFAYGRRLCVKNH
ncbi:hypothetical protein IC615_17570 [Serratia ureilytica]